MIKQARGFQCYAVTMRRTDTDIDIKYIVVATDAITAIEWAAEVIGRDDLVCSSLSLLGTRVITDSDKPWRVT